MNAASILQRQNARTAKDSGVVNRGHLTPERARILGVIGARKAADAKRGKTSVPRCVGCLLAIGWGQKRIARHTGVPKTSIHRWAKFNGLNLSATAEQKKAADMAARKRKAETNLRIEKDGDLSVCWSEKQRRAPIFKDKGPRFRWSDEKQMHVSAQAEPAETSESRKQREYRDLAEATLGDGAPKQYRELVAACQAARSTPSSTPAERTAERWIREMSKLGLIVQAFGAYRIGGSK